MNKYNKVHKKSNVYKEVTKISSTLKGGVIGLKSLGYAQITDNQIESARKYISKLTKRNCKLWIRTKNTFSKTKKPIGSRMGKGIGSYDKHVSILRKGTIILELFYNTLVTKLWLQKILFVISKKLSVSVQIYQKNIKGIY